MQENENYPGPEVSSEMAHMKVEMMIHRMRRKLNTA